MYFIHELPENVVNLLYELAALSVKSSYPEYDRKKIDNILIDFENEKIKDIIPLLREYIEPKTGLWVGEADGYADGELVYDIWSCGNCGTYFDEWEEEPTWNYCPVCGKMKR